MSKRTKESKKKLNSLLLIILLTAILMIASTYAWFSTQKDVTLSNLKGTVNIAEGLEGSIDGKTWGNTIDLASIEDSLDGKTIKPSELLPVSGAAETDALGGTTIPLFRGNLMNQINLKNITACNETRGEHLNNPSNLASPSYIAFDLYLKDTTRSDGPKTVLQLNKNSKCIATNTNSGLQNAMRVGLARFSTGVEVLSNETQVTSGDYGTVEDVAIWEPNADTHIQYIVDNNKLKAPIQATGGKPIETLAVDKDAVGSEIANVFESEPTKNIKQNALQTKYGAEGLDGVYNLKSSKDGTTDFTILANKISKVRVYLWLEGGDVDCANVASHGKDVTVTLGLIKGESVVVNGK